MSRSVLGNCGTLFQLFTHLDEMVLHDIPDNAKLVKVTAPSFGAKRLLERDLDVADVLIIPNGAQEGVCKAQHQHVLHELLA